MDNKYLSSVICNKSQSVYCQTELFSVVNCNESSLCKYLNCTTVLKSYQELRRNFGLSLEIRFDLEFNIYLDSKPDYTVQTYTVK